MKLALEVLISVCEGKVVRRSAAAAGQLAEQHGNGCGSRPSLMTTGNSLYPLFGLLLSFGI